MFIKELEDDNTIQTWLKIVNDFFTCYDRKKGTYIFLPYEGGFYDQDSYMWTLWEYIRYLYIMFMNDENFLQELSNRKTFLQKINNKKG